MLVEVSFQEGQPETYLLPIAHVEGAAEAALSAAHPDAVIARIEGGGVLADALFLPEVRERWLRLHLAADPALPFHAPPDSRRSIRQVVARCAGTSRVVEADRANTSIAFGDTLLLKVYRRFEHGAHPEVELLDALQRRSNSRRAPPIYSALSATVRTSGAVVSSLTGYVAHQGDGWTFTLDALSRYFDRALESRLDPATCRRVGGRRRRVVQSECARSAGSIAALHRALAGESGATLAPEPFGALLPALALPGHARAGRARAACCCAKRSASSVTRIARLAARVIEGRPAILRIFGVLAAPSGSPRPRRACMAICILASC